MAEPSVLAVYVFGSVIEGNVTGSSDIDVLVVVPDYRDELETYNTLARELEERLGSLAYLVDLHVVKENQVAEPPYKWWIKRAVKVL